MQQGNGLQSPLRPLSVLFFHLLLAHLCSGQSQLIAPSQPIVAKVGDDIILPCHLEPEADVVAMTLEWTRSDLNPRFVHVRRASQDIVRVQHPSFTGRTSVSIDDLKHGNVSLKLSKVKPSDAGRYQCYIPKLNMGAFVELIVGAASSLVISLSEIIRNKGAVVLQCKSTGWYPEPEVFWLDGEGNLLSAGPTETVRGPDDLYTVSSRVTVEKRHSNSFTCRVQQNHTNQIRETHIHVPDDFFEVQSSSSSTIAGLAVSLAVCILVILILGFFVWKWRQNIFNQTDKGEKKNLSKRNDAEYQVVTVEEPERQQLLTDGTDQIKDLKERQAAGIRPEEEQLRRRESGKVQKILKEELETKKTEIRQKLSDLQQLDEEKKKKEQEVKRLKEHLENKKTEVKTLGVEQGKCSRYCPETMEKEQKKRKEAENEADNLKQQLETEEKELDTKTKEFNDKQVEVQQLQEEIQKKETNLKTLMEELESNNKESNDKQAEVQKLQQQIEKMESGLQTLMEDLDSDTLEDLKKHVSSVSGKSSTPRSDWMLLLMQKFQEEQKKRKEAEKKVQTLEEELQTKTTEKQNSSSLSQNSTTRPAVVFKVDRFNEYIQLINTSTQDQQLGGWNLKIQVNNNKPVIHQFTDSFNLQADQHFTVGYCGYDRKVPPADLVLEDLQPWSRTDNLQVSLISYPGQIQYNYNNIRLYLLKDDNESRCLSIVSSI
ncbi:lamin-A-like [Acanthopagrus latus]|uniref:lamin-A-like n=1 Tax=Acanthopagrus latus TaxID=8177 RepID=UPI00187C92A7|nr:lamin-A-like [Acanthopagrus latus]XP_036967310.1 lamin-A-like [Acanthopagrus latus]